MPLNKYGELRQLGDKLYGANSENKALKAKAAEYELLVTNYLKHSTDFQTKMLNTAPEKFVNDLLPSFLGKHYLPLHGVCKKTGLDLSEHLKLLDNPTMTIGSFLLKEEVDISQPIQVLMIGNNGDGMIPEL